LPRGFCLSGYEVCLSRFDAIKTNFGAALRELWHSDGVSPGFSLAFQFVQCDNSTCKSKGKRVMVRRKNHCAYGFDLKF